MRVLITGAGGQLACDLEAAFDGCEVRSFPRSLLDITDTEQVKAAVEDQRPDVLVNTAAYHLVDRCETEPELSFQVNAAAPQRLARVCDGRGVLLVHYSTDYVFDGERRTPYPEDAVVRPLNVYGASKAAGEMAIRATTDRHLIIRTTGLFGPAARPTGRANFVETMLRLGVAGRPLDVVADQVLTPTSTADVAQVTRALITAQARGTFHVTNSGSCSWYQFAREIFQRAGISVDLRPTTQRDRPAPARRPVYSVLAHDGILNLGFHELRSWQEALSDYLDKRAEVVPSWPSVQ